jgi:hypothetical protein
VSGASKCLNSIRFPWRLFDFTVTLAVKLIGLVPIDDD